MADNTKEVIIKVSADTSEVDTALDNTKQKLNDVGNTKVDKSIKSLKTQLKESTLEAEKLGQQFGQNSEQFAKAAKRVAELRDAIEENNATFKSFNPDNKLQAVVGVARTAATAVQGVGGAMSFLGVESKTAMETMAKLQGIMAFTDALNSIGDLTYFWKGYVLQLKAARTATQAQKSATEGATVATKGLGTAFKAIGIGLLISAIAYLITNWDDLKESVTDLFPSLKDTGKSFDEIKQVVYGVGNAIMKFLVGPINALIKLLQFDFNGAMNAIKSSLNIIGNYDEGSKNQFLAQEEDKLNKIVQKNIKHNDDIIAIKKAAGENTYQLEKENNAKRLSLLKKGTEEYDKVLQDQALLDASRQKEINEKRKQAAEKAAQEAKAQRAKELDEIKQAEEDAEKTLLTQNKSAKELELAGLTEKFNRTRKLYDDHHKDVTKLTEAYNIDKAAIEEKYSKIIGDYIGAYQDSKLDEYEKKKKDIDKEINELLKNATDSERQALENLRKEKKKYLDDEKTSGNTVKNTEENLKRTIRTNVIEDDDSLNAALDKSKNIYEAQVKLENAQFEDKKLRAKGNAEALQAIEVENKNRLLELLGDYTNQANNLRKADAERQKQYGYDLVQAEQEVQDLKFEAVQTGLGMIESLAGKNRKLADIAFGLSKALAIGEIIVNTQKEIAGYWSNPLWSAMPDGGTALKTAMTAKAKLRAGISIASIAATTIGKYMNNGGSSGGSSGGDSGGFNPPQAPSINVNQLSEQRIQDVRVTNSQDTVRAYITERDLETYQQKQDFKEKMKI